MEAHSPCEPYGDLRIKFVTGLAAFSQGTLPFVLLASSSHFASVFPRRPSELRIIVDSSGALNVAVKKSVAIVVSEKLFAFASSAFDVVVAVAATAVAAE